jgi:hypothetical protein
MKWDYFISYSHEDRMTIAQPLANSLKDAGFKVWYDEFSIKLGDNLLSSIDKGLANSRFGIVIISHSYLSKNWTFRELSSLLEFETFEKKVVLPILHNISIEELRKKTPIISSKIMVSTIKGIPFVLKSIVDASFPERTDFLFPTFFIEQKTLEENKILARIKEIILDGKHYQEMKSLFSSYNFLFSKFGFEYGLFIPVFEFQLEDIFDFIVIKSLGSNGNAITFIRMEHYESELNYEYYQKLINKISYGLGFESKEMRENRMESLKLFYPKIQKYIEKYTNKFIEKFSTDESCENIEKNWTNSYDPIVNEYHKTASNLRFLGTTTYDLKFDILVISGRRGSFDVNLRNITFKNAPFNIQMSSYDRIFDKL